MPKYRELHSQVAESNIPGVDLTQSTPACPEQILLVHTHEYFWKVAHGNLTDREIRRIGLPWSPALFNRTMYAVGGTIDACRAAAGNGIAANLAGGTHHAHPDHGEGYCVFNDVAVAAKVIQNEGLIERLLIIDCDAHQGNGSAVIFSHDPSVCTFSIHAEKNFPYHKALSDWDIALPDGSGDNEYLTAIYQAVPEIVMESNPDFIVYIAGADPFFDDRLGRLSLTKEGLAQRDQWVLNYCRKLGLPTAIVLGGGYARQIEDVVDIHLETIRIAADIDRKFMPSGTLSEI